MGNSTFMLLFVVMLSTLVACQEKAVIATSGYLKLSKGTLGSDSALNFPDTSAYLTSTNSLTVSNQGEYPLTFDAFSSLTDSGFEVLNTSTCTIELELQENQSCTFNFKFSPLVAAPFQKKFTVRYLSDGAVSSYAITLTGTGIEARGVQINSAVGQADPTAAFPVSFTVLFAVPIDLATFTSADLTQTGTATGVNWNIVDNGDGKTFTVTATSIATDGTIVPVINADDVLNPGGLGFFASTSTDNSVLVDTTSPVDNTASVQFTAAYDANGSDVAVTWTAFTDANLVNHRLRTYTNAACTVGLTDHGLTTSATNSNSTIIDGLADGTYYATVTAVDVVGQTTTSACSTDTIIVDSTAPTDNTANLQFTDATDNDGDNIAVTWTAFTDANLSDHRLYTYTNAACTVGETDHGLISGNGNSNNTIIDGLAAGTYYGRVRAVDAAGNTTLSACSSDSILIDKLSPTDLGASLQFGAAYDADGNDVSVTWTAFSDANLTNHRLHTYTDSACTLGEVDHGLTGSASNANAAIIDGLGNGTYWGIVTAVDAAGNTKASACSTDSIIVDVSAPTDNTANLQFSSAAVASGDNVAVTWTAFTDTYLANHRLYTFTDAACSANQTDHGTTLSATNSNSSDIDGLADGTYYGKVSAIDSAGNSTLSACSTDSIIIDTTLPTDNTANLQFTNAYDNDGNNIAVTWTAFSDTNLSDHRLHTYTNSSCTTGAVDHGLTGSSTNSNSTIIDGRTNGTYYARVTAVDLAGNTRQSACSTDSIIVDTTQPSVSSINRNTGTEASTLGTSVVFRVTFSEPVLNVATSDFALTNTWDLTGGTVDSINPISTSVYEVTVTTLAGDGFVRLDLNDADSSITDLAGNTLSSTTRNGDQTFGKWTTPLISSWKTDNAGVTSSTEIRIPINAGSTNLIVDWGDGSNVTYITNLSDAVKTHTYASAGTYTVKIYGQFSGFYFNNSGDAQKILNISQWGPNRFTSFMAAFYGATNFNITATDTPDLSGVTSFNQTFRNCTSLTSGLTDWETSAVTNMAWTFGGATSFNQDLVTNGAIWDVSNVTVFSYMFNGATNFNGNITSWDTGSATNLSYMFQQSAFNRNINTTASSWDVSNVTNFSYMFYYNTVFNQNLNNWDTSKATTFQSMFYGASAFNGDVTTWDTHLVTNMNGMFGLSGFNRSLNTTGNIWNVGNVTDMGTMFYYAANFNGTLTGWDTSKVTSMSSMFSNATSFNQPVGHFNTALVTSMGFMFRAADSFDQPINTNGNLWNVGNVTNMGSMFRQSGFNQSIADWDTSKVTNMSSMFQLSPFNQPLVRNGSKWDTSKVTNMSQMFYQNVAYNQDLSSWDVTLVTDSTNFSSWAGWVLPKPSF